MASKSTWDAEADRDLLVAMAMSEGGNKPNPKWEKVQGIMADWGYGFTASAMYQHFSKRIWKQVVDKRGEVTTPTKTTPTKPRRASAASTPKKRGRGPKEAAADGDHPTDDSDTDIGGTTPSKKPRASAKVVVKQEDEVMGLLEVQKKVEEKGI